MTDDNKPLNEVQGFGDLLSDIDEDSYPWRDEEPQESAPADKSRPVVSFRIGEDLFAVAGGSVREIVGPMEATELPGSPEHIRGITILRRQVVGLLSLRKFLNLGNDDHKRAESGDDGTTARTVIVETAHYTVGLLVDEVTGLSEWPESALDSSTLPDNINDGTRRYARGAHPQGERLCIYLDLENLLDNAAVQ